MITVVIEPLNKKKKNGTTLELMMEYLDDWWKVIVY